MHFLPPAMQKRAENVEMSFLNRKTFYYFKFQVYIAAGPAYYVLHPQKSITIGVFFNLPGLQRPGRNHFSDKSCWVI